MIDGKTPQRIHMGGKPFRFRNLSGEIQEDIKKRLAEKDPVMDQGKKGILSGIKIDGKQVTTDNIKDFEKGSKPKAKTKEVKKSGRKTRKSRR